MQKNLSGSLVGRLRAGWCHALLGLQWLAFYVSNEAGLGFLIRESLVEYRMSSEENYNTKAWKDKKNLALFTVRNLNQTIYEFFSSIGKTLLKVYNYLFPLRIELQEVNLRLYHERFSWN